MKAVFLPFRGEFGQMLMTHVRWVQGHPAEHKIVCCRPGDEALFPSADQFFYDWEDIPDEAKCTDSLLGRKNRHELGLLQDRIGRMFTREELPGLKFLTPLDGQKPQRFRPDRAWNFKPQPKPSPKGEGLDVDIVVGPRYRKHGLHRNYIHWSAVIDGLLEMGLRVALTGMKATSVDHPGVRDEYKSWNHDVLDTTLVWMNRARLTLTTDCGIAHLAVLNQTPLKVIYGEPGREAGHPTWPWVLPRMREMAVAPVDPICYGWDNPSLVLDTVASLFDAQGEKVL